MDGSARLCVALCLCFVGREALAGQLCGGMDSCSEVWDLKVHPGETRSVTLPLEATMQKLVDKCNPQTGEWEELLLSRSEHSFHSSGEEERVSLIHQEFTVRRAERKHEGFYKIIPLLSNGGICLALVNVTLLDSPLFETAIPSSTALLPATTQPSPPGTSQPSPPGSNDNIAMYVIIPVLGILAIIIGGLIVAYRFVPKWNKRKPEPSQPTSAGYELCENGLPPQQQQGSTLV